MHNFDRAFCSSQLHPDLARVDQPTRWLTMSPIKQQSHCNATDRHFRGVRIALDPADARVLVGHPATLPMCLPLACPSQHLRQLDNNPITLDVLRATPGFKAFDGRRVAKCEKQLEGGAMFDINRSFYEGADAQLWEHWQKDPAQHR
eukprot:365325-Chlamydomonas_euryale.AAC.11